MTTINKFMPERIAGSRVFCRSRDVPGRFLAEPRVFSRSQDAVYGLIIAACLTFMAGCHGPMDNLETVLARHQQAVETIPAARHEQLMIYGPAVRNDKAAELLPDDILKLETARSIAARANPDVHAALARLEAAWARISEAQARFLPTVTASHNSARTFQTPASRNRLNTLLQPAQPVPADVDVGNPALTTLLNALRRPLFGAPKATGNRNPFSEHSSALTLTWTAFDGFVRDAQVLATKHLRQAATHGLVDVERLIVHAVDTAYFQVQLAQEQVRIARADETFSREQFEETEKLREAGRASQADVDNFRVRMLAAQASLTAARGVRETGRVVLAELMGIPSSTLPPELGLSPLEAETEEEMTVPEVDPWLTRAVANRPDLQQFGAALRSEEERVRAARGVFSPTVLVSGSFGFDHSSSMRYTFEDQSSAAAVEVRWDLYTGGSRRARLRIAQAVAAEAAANYDRLRLAVQSEVRSAIIDLADAQEQIRLQRESLETARENRRIVRAAYLAGKETLTRLNEAQRDVIEADANLALARIRLRQAWSDLHSAGAAGDGGS